MGDQGIVTVCVEYENEPHRQFIIHKHLLSPYATFSTFFGTQEGKVMVLHDVHPDTFETFSAWLYTKELVVEEMEEAQEGSGGVQRSGDGRNKTWFSGLTIKDRVLGRLLDLYAFASKYKVTDFKVAVMLEFQRSANRMNRCPGITGVRHAIDKLDLESSPMYKYLVHCYCCAPPYHTTAEYLAGFPARFLAQIILLANHALAGRPVSNRHKNWCDYHEHENDDKRKECENSRPDDVDIKKRN